MLTKMLGIRSGEKFSNILDRNRGVGPGFDVLRISLALLLLVLHARWIAGGSGFGQLLPGIGDLVRDPNLVSAATEKVGFTKALRLMIVPSFFALSGFLVMGSAFRLRATSTFLMHRFLRIFPALIVEVTLSALLLGAALTTLPLQQYFTDPVFFRYFGNMIGWISFDLPGVFKTNHIQNFVNINLWTLPSEFHCYLVTAFLLMTKTIYNKKMYTIVFIAATIGMAIGHYMTGMSTPEQTYPPHVIVYYFFVGVFAFHYKNKIPASPWLFLACAIVSYICTSFDALVYLATLPLTYCTLFIGMIEFPKNKLISSGDYSYGIYLYGFPISQAYIYLYPKFSEHIFLLILVAAATTFVFAAFSWHVIEKRVLAYKKKLPQKYFPLPAKPLAHA